MNDFSAHRQLSLRPSPVSFTFAIVRVSDGFSPKFTPWFQEKLLSLCFRRDQAIEFSRRQFSQGCIPADTGEGERHLVAPLLGAQPGWPSSPRQPVSLQRAATYLNRSRQAPCALSCTSESSFKASPSTFGNGALASGLDSLLQCQTSLASLENAKLHAPV